MRAKDNFINQIPEKCKQCKTLPKCVEWGCKYEWWWEEQERLCGKYNWFRWENALTKFEVCP